MTASREPLPEITRMVLDHGLTLLEETQAAVARLEAQMAAIANADADCRRLMTIPQVGPLTALVMRAEGGDMRRFRQAKQLVADCGLCPSVYARGGQVSSGRLSTACHRLLRYALLLRASGMTKLPHDNPLKQAYWRVAVRDHVNSGTRHRPRQLIRIMQAMLTRKDAWTPPPFAGSSPCACGWYELAVNKLGDPACATASVQRRRPIDNSQQSHQYGKGGERARSDT